MGDKPESDTIEAKFARRLAGNEKRARDRALKKLKQFMNLRAARPDGGFTRIEMLSIWKGLFYCMWMSDKPLVQEELANTISDLMTGLPNVKTAMLFFDVFLETMQREWRGIDRLRMDKFYLLVRCILGKGFRFIESHEWDVGVTDWLLAILKNGPICPTNAMLGLHYHMCDIYLEELAKVSKDSLSHEMMLKFLDPYCIFITKAKNFDLVKSAVDEVFQQLVENSKPALELLAEEDEDLVDIRSHTQLESYDSSPITALSVPYGALADRIFELASQDGVLARNRKKAFVLVEKFRELAEGRLPLCDIPNAEYSSEDELAKLQNCLTEEIVSENTREMTNKQNKKVKKRKRRTEKDLLRDEGKASEDTEAAEEYTSEPLHDAEEDIAKSAPPMKKRKKKRKAAEKVADMGSEDATMPTDTSLDGLPLKNHAESLLEEEDRSPAATKPQTTPKRKKKKNPLRQKTGADATADAVVLSPNDLVLKNSIKALKPGSNCHFKNGGDSVTGANDSQSAPDLTNAKKAAIQTKEEIVSTSPNAPGTQNSPKRKRKRKNVKPSAVIVGSRLSKEHADAENSFQNSADDTVLELNRGKKHRTEGKPGRQSAALPQNMPDILQDVVTKPGKQDGGETAAEKQHTSFKHLKRWLKTGDGERVRKGTHGAEKAAMDTNAVVKVKPKLCKRRRNSVDWDPAEIPKVGDAATIDNSPAEKFATFARVDPQRLPSTFVKFSAAKVEKKTKNRHLAAIKTRAKRTTAAHTPKKVAFELSKTQVQCFRKTDRTSAVSPSPDTIAFDPRKTPGFGVLKGKRAKKAVARGRKAASDFF